MVRDEKIGSNSPLYLQLRELIRGKVENGEYLPGTAIPSVGALAETYGIHRLSVRSAISALIGEGLLKSVQGKGIFVVGGKLEQDLDTVGGFKQNMLGRTARNENRVLVKCRRPAGAICAAVFGCAPESEVFYIRQLRCVDGEPVSLEEIYLPVERMPHLMEIDLSVFSIREVQDFYGVTTVRSEQSLEITQLDSIDARLLEIDPRRGVLMLRSVGYDEEGRKAELSYSYTRGDKCTFSVRYHR